MVYRFDSVRALELVEEVCRWRIGVPRARDMAEIRFAVLRHGGPDDSIWRVFVFYTWGAHLALTVISGR